MKALIPLAALALSACATAPVSGAPAAPAASLPETPLNLGDWRTAGANAASQHFEREVAARYRAGVATSAVSADLRRSEFACAPGGEGGPGNLPDLICRRTISVAGCTHTWQVHVFEAEGGREVARSRAIYDRRCGGDGLLGGPS